MRVEIVTHAVEVRPGLVNWGYTVGLTDAIRRCKGVGEGKEFNKTAGHLLALESACLDIHRRIDELRWLGDDRMAGDCLILRAAQWRLDGWRTRSGKSIRYPDIWERALEAYHKISPAISFNCLLETDQRILEIKKYF